ncbi:hypothetical protein FNV43_RR09992 [Rhamnella rubrinervis]|uniref:Uncharacterized protein n=1 Tax=Rhamnella rubrinervis TaxID=2594499 RepID=A0A8K0HCA0_9ROSA|nr:hypothetical protein FNV43_RR09992 [Rhamnella rubrinervis]
MEPILENRNWKWSTTTTEILTSGSGNEDLATDLPGQPQVNFQHYAGYVKVNESQWKGSFFYWFYEAASNSDKKPLVLWLSGGTRCSSVGYGATQ